MYNLKPFIFVSYAHEDSRWFEKGSLMPRLVQSLEIQGNVDVWYDKRRIDGADIWRDEIETAIDRANIAILLVSQSFLNSKFIMQNEMPRLVKRAEAKQLIIFPILVGYCDWNSIEALSRPQMMPGEPTPLVEYLEPAAKWERVQHEIFQALLKQIKKHNAQTGLIGDTKPSRETETSEPENADKQQTQPRERSQWVGRIGNLSEFVRKNIIALAIGVLLLAVVAFFLFKDGEKSTKTGSTSPEMIADEKQIKDDAFKVIGDSVSGTKTQSSGGQPYLAARTGKTSGAQELKTIINKKDGTQLTFESGSIKPKAHFIAQELAEHLPKDCKIPFRLAMTNLSYQDLRISSPFLRYFQEQIFIRLSQLPQFQVIKESELQNAIRTRSISVTQKNTPDSPQGIIDFTHADGVLIGRCREKENNQLSVTVEIIESSSKAAITSSNVLIRKDQIPKNLPLLPTNIQDIRKNTDILNDVSSLNANLEVKLWMDHLDGGIYQEGEKMQAYLWANKECYLNLIYHDAAGNDILIFPNAYRTENQIIGNTVYEIPGKTDRFDFTVVQPCGVEILKAFVSTRPLPKLEGNEVDSGIKMLELPLKKIAETLRSIKITKRSDNNIPEAESSNGRIERAEASCVVTTVTK